MKRQAYTAKDVMSSGPYSHAIDAGEYIYVSGQTAKNSLTLEKQVLTIQEQTEECFKNINRILKEMNLTEANIVKANVYLTGMKHFEGMNEVYKTKFTEPYPARTCVAVLELPLKADIEIEVVAKR
ncbi:RidA family protein [Trichococcus collinsii]|uniref:2-iminobutanoate/2-iminopropanoate deaminase n=1 Tax=Trichococcus collinsii TaxID=157076 RepID=A0AB38A3E6_9LACT|nr:RidA family protein [Trichococcus collinsii]CZQ99871.1 endoribonuclease l-psp [Trichococcus collinsii]SEA89112.1 2-iminobutanoate/2-iminopropanoate deaminase [Trichococcus collinsii]